MNTELVSIYMPTRNRVDLLERAAQSVLEQTYENLELLIVDDGSTDSTPVFLESLSKKDARVTFFRNAASRGAPVARNIAIEHARGKWITGIDDDDWFAPPRLEIFVKSWLFFDQADVEFSGLFSQDFYEESNSSSLSAKRGAVSWWDLFEFNSVGNQIFTLTERIREIGMFDPNMPAWQDLDLFIRLLMKYGAARLIDIPLYHLNVEDRPDRISTSGRARIMAAFERLQKKHSTVDNRLLQQLFLQCFGKLYGHRPTPSDVVRFASYGLNLGSMARFLSLIVRRR